MSSYNFCLFHDSSVLSNIRSGVSLGAGEGNKSLGNKNALDGAWHWGAACEAPASGGAVQARARVAKATASRSRTVPTLAPRSAVEKAPAKQHSHPSRTGVQRSRTGCVEEGGSSVTAYQFARARNGGILQHHFQAARTVPIRQPAVHYRRSRPQLSSTSSPTRSAPPRLVRRREAVALLQAVPFLPARH